MNKKEKIEWICWLVGTGVIIVGLALFLTSNDISAQAILSIFLITMAAISHLIIKPKLRESKEMDDSKRYSESTKRYVLRNNRQLRLYIFLPIIGLCAVITFFTYRTEMEVRSQEKLQEGISELQNQIIEEYNKPKEPEISEEEMEEIIKRLEEEQHSNEESPNP